MEKAKFKRIIEAYYEANAASGISFDDTEELSDKVMKSIVNPVYNVNYDTGIETEDLLTKYALAYQEQGFILGFIYAMQLKEECDLLSTAKAVQV